MKRLVEIIKAEGVEITQDNVGELKEALKIIADVSNGDMRKALKLLETVLSSKTAITPDNVKTLIAPDTAVIALNHALRGDLEAAVRTLEDAIIMNKLSADATIEQLYDAIARLNGVDTKVKAKLYIELARAEHAIKMGGSPLIQLSAVLSTAWVLSMGQPR